MILAGRNAVVTGGAVRIGREIGRCLALAGVNVCVHYGTSGQQAQEAVQEFESYGVKGAMVSADLAEPVQASRIVMEHANKTLGKISILINSAAIFEAGSLRETTESGWDRHFDINLKSPFFLTQAFVKQLGNEQGAVVNLVDWRGERPLPGHIAYTIGKAGLIAQTRLLAQELGPQVSVNGVAPGAILPAPGESMDSFEEKSELNPLRRTGSPQAIAEAVLYLLRADFVTGEILHVTGGQQL